MSFKIDGFDEINKLLNNVEKTASNLSGDYSFDEIFSQQFMHSNTKFDSIYDFFKKFNIPTSQEEFENFPEGELDEIVKNNTQFQSWKSMFDSAVEHFISSKLPW